MTTLPHPFAHQTMPSPPPTYESLTHIEYLLESADAATLAHQTRLTTPIYARRAALAARIPHFWALVLEQAPPDVEVHVQPSDGEVLNAALVGVEVERFEVVTAAEAEAGASAGDARSFLVRLRFDPARNTLFSDEVLEKRIYFRRAADGAGVRVSDPVPIAWRAGADPTRGLTDLAVALHVAEKALGGAEPAGEGETRAEARERRRGLAERIRALPEHVELRERVEREAEGAASFFAWFAWRGGRRVGVAEGRANVARLEAGFARAEAGEDAGEDGEEEEEDELDAQAGEVDVFSAGEELALALAEDVWPGAIRYFSEFSGGAARGDGNGRGPR